MAKNVRYVITNDDYNFSYLHTNGYFYNCIIRGVKCELVVYKNLKSAQKKALKKRGYVLCVENGQRLSEGKIIY
jgi:hypothetical protein